MIFDTIENIDRYTTLGYNLGLGLRFLVENSLSSLPLGRTDVDGDQLYVLVQEYDTRPVEQGKWEAHRQYIDIQYMVDGQERMGFANIRNMALGEYIPERDFQSLTGEGNYVDVFSGAFVIFFPEDAHKPGLAVNNPEPIRKVVLKVRCA